MAVRRELDILNFAPKAGSRDDSPPAHHFQFGMAVGRELDSVPVSSRVRVVGTVSLSVISPLMDLVKECRLA